MLKHSLPSIEKFAAFLDGNLPQNEMQQFSQLVEHDSVLNQLLDASDALDDTIAGFSDADLQLPFEISSSDFEIPDIDNVPDNTDFLSMPGDSFSDNDHLYLNEGNIADENYQQELETFKNSIIMNESYLTFGESGENLIDPVYVRQPDDHSCALRSQQIVLRDFGIDIPFDKLEELAKQYGVYTDEGTYTYDIGKVLQIAGVDMHQVEGSTLLDLTNELAQGHRVIVSVDAYELWKNDTIMGNLKNWFNDAIGNQGGNHALIVAGVEVNPNDANDVKVVLTDPGSGDLRIEYPLNQFMDAWNDSNCFMAATDNAAPYQYDPQTGMEVPSCFVVQQYVNDFVASNGYQLAPDMINIPQDYQPTFTDHLDMVGDMDYQSFVDSYNEMVDNRILSPLSVKEQIEEYAKAHVPFLKEETASSVGVDNPRVGETAGSVGQSSVYNGETAGSVDFSEHEDDADDESMHLDDGDDDFGNHENEDLSGNDLEDGDEDEEDSM